MNKNFLKVNYNCTIKSVFGLMVEMDVEEAFMIDEKSNLIGIITTKDVEKLIRRKVDLNERIYKYAKKKVYSIKGNLSVKDARNFMMTKGIGRVPVIENNKITGVLTNNNIRDNFYLELEKMFELNNKIIDNLHEAVCICDDAGTVKVWNKSAEKLYGVTKDEIVGRYLGDIFPNALIFHAIKEKKPLENRIHSPKEGKTVILSAIPIYNNGKLIAVASSDRDITEVTALSEELKKTKEKMKLLQKEYEREIASNYSFSTIIGSNQKIIECIQLAQKVSQTSASVLITGESGTGKEVFAKAIHKASGRSGHFVAINCSAIPAHLLESELFGYDKGAFTGAVNTGKIGKFEFANNGTLFLDEIGDMPLEMQVKILRVLQDGIVYRLGSSKGIVTNTRIIAATNKDLKKLILEDKFREDLYYRLAVVQLELPSLRERKEDIVPLANYFIKQIVEKEEIELKEIEDEVYSILKGYEWKGNIRELKNVIERMIILCDKGYITKEFIPKYIVEASVMAEEENEYDLEKAVRNMEERIIRDVMHMSGGNKLKAAKILNIKRSTLYYKLKLYNIK
ncbi:sigma-54-dependent Fis family transcriptional regulator [Anaeromicrobium sediminis]|uniref:Sigma-54-dependent Fis family transcriptional regulator n=2 Tax=Anaeromicrobium sediminis TaxID=1478221 RepID=A0A267MKS6_9FIRM|nr:sigma-54-dependent Fis family transcriptional regulator [Anaeromicrobium sediminis]